MNVRITFLIIVFLHGLIHLLGFVKAFGLMEVKELTLPISKSAGFFWLLAAVLFVICAAMYLSGSTWAWLPGFLAVLISQVLVIMFWKDARFGTIPNAIILPVVFVSLGGFLIHREFQSRVVSDFTSNNTLSTEILTDRDIAHLPPLVQKYLHYTRSVGQPKIRNFRAEFVGGMRSKPEDDYMQMHSVQYNFYQKPSRYFFMTATKAGLPATGLHIYRDETATFTVKMLNWLKVVDAAGDKMNQAETVTVLNDMCFIAPATLIDRRITWEEIDSTTVKATYTNGNLSISAVLYFRENGELINFISHDRYETDGKQYRSYPWATPVEAYRMINGYFLPGKAKLIYKKPDGDFTYGELEYKSVNYNLVTFLHQQPEEQQP